jgi:hypothetical protein
VNGILAGGFYWDFDVSDWSRIYVCHQTCLIGLS